MAACIFAASAFAGCAKTAPDNAGSAESTAPADAAGSAQETEETKEEISLEEQLKLAWNFLTEGNYKEAVLAFTAVIDIDPKNGDAYRGRAESYLGLAGNGGSGLSAEDYANYLALAAGDYDLAAQYLEDAEGLAAARQDRNRQLYQACMQKAHAAMEAGDTEEMFEQMRRASLVEGSANYGYEEIDVWYAEYLPFVQNSGEMDTILAFNSLLMEMTDNSGLTEGGASPWLQMLDTQVVGYQEKVFVTTDYIESIDRPLVEFIRAHEEYLESRNAFNILYNGSIALGDLETAGRIYPLMVEKIQSGVWRGGSADRTYDYRADGYSWTGTNRQGYRHDTCEFDIYGHCIARTAHLDVYEGNDGHVPYATDEVWSFEYEGSGPRLLRSEETSTNARGTYTLVQTYTYADGRLVRLEELYTWTGETAVTEYSYSGMNVTVTYTSTQGQVRTEERVVNYQGHAALLK